MTSLSPGAASSGATWWPTPFPELHAFARRLGLRQAWFQAKSAYPHYDVTVNLRDRALTLGASMGDRQTIISCARLLKHELVSEQVAVSQS